MVTETVNIGCVPWRNLNKHNTSSNTINPDHGRSQYNNDEDEHSRSPNRQVEGDLNPSFVYSFSQLNSIESESLDPARLLFLSPLLITPAQHSRVAYLMAFNPSACLRSRACHG
jgi:hypothetical protein